MISEKLLSDVFLEEIYTDIEIKNAEYDCEETEWKEVYFNHKRIPLDFVAHKCKEWASGYGYLIANSFYTGDSVNSKESKCYVQNWIGDWITVYTSQESSEPEAIFKACQWILDNKDLV